MSGNLWMFSDMLDDEDIEMQKHDFINGKYDEDLHQYILMRIALKISKFNI